MAIHSRPLDFKFRFARKDGATDLAQMFRKQGRLTSDGLTLGKDTLIHDQLTGAAVQDERLALMIRPGSELPKRLRKALFDDDLLVLDLTRGSAPDIKARLDGIHSAAYAAEHRSQLIKQGREEEFRILNCSVCGATIDLSGLEKSDYIHCPYCESLSKSGLTVSDGNEFRVCDNCGLFGRVKGYTEFYFYFLIIIFGYRSSRVHACDTCANRMFLKTFFLNFLFLLGLPASIAIKIKSMRGHTDFSRALADANRFARKGRYSEADKRYRALFGQHPGHPGLSYNETVGHLVGEDAVGGGEALQRTLRSCSNYYPALALLEDDQ
jgi:hypothetical protein